MLFHTSIVYNSNNNSSNNNSSNNNNFNNNDLNNNANALVTLLIATVSYYCHYTLIAIVPSLASILTYNPHSDHSNPLVYIRSRWNVSLARRWAIITDKSLVFQLFSVLPFSEYSNKFGSWYLLSSE